MKASPWATTVETKACANQDQALAYVAVGTCTRTRNMLTGDIWQRPGTVVLGSSVGPRRVGHKWPLILLKTMLAMVPYCFAVHHSAFCTSYISMESQSLTIIAGMGHFSAVHSIVFSIHSVVFALTCNLALLGQCRCCPNPWAQTLPRW